MHSFGGHILRLPLQDYENKKDLDVFFITRDSYERILRRLVRNSSKRIRWMTGTATGLKTVVDSSSVESVRVRTAEGRESEEPASLVVGKFSLLNALRQLICLCRLLWIIASRS